MDEMIIGSKLMRMLIERWIKKTIRRRIGCDMNIRLGKIIAKNDGDTIKLHIDGDVDMTSKDFEKVMNILV